MHLIVHAFLIAIITSVILSIVWFLISLVRHRNDVADIGWGTYFVGIGIAVFLSYHARVDLRIVPLLLVIIWAVRLSSHIFMRHLHTTEDARYLAWHKQWGNGAYFYIRSFLQVFLLQAVLATVIAAPLILIESSNRVHHFIPLLIVGTAVWIFGFLFESIGDRQLKVFLADPVNRGHIMQSGLWKYSRHPNYFGEVTQWWGIFIIGLSATHGWIGIIGPLVITLLIVFVSGIPLAEAGMASKPEFQEYKTHTSPLVPLPRY